MSSWWLSSWWLALSSKMAMAHKWKWRGRARRRRTGTTRAWTPTRWRSFPPLARSRRRRRRKHDHWSTRKEQREKSAAAAAAAKGLPQAHSGRTFPSTYIQGREKKRAKRNAFRPFGGPFGERKADNSQKATDNLRERRRNSLKSRKERRLHKKTSHNKLP